MRVVIGKATEEAMGVLGLKQYPFTSKDLKNRFRSSAFLHHKDTGGNDEKMRKVLESYKVLVHLSIDVEEEEVTPVEEVEANMFDLFESKKCFDCGGTGKRTIYEDLSVQSCLKCRGTGKTRLRCKFCKDGKFTLRNGRIVDCRACGGIGVFYPVCNSCGGDGYRRYKDYASRGISFAEARKNNSEEVICGSCKGKGTIRTKLSPFNPVIPKGAIL